MPFPPGPNPGPPASSPARPSSAGSRGAAADDERSRRCRHLFTGAGRAGGGSSCRARARVAPPQRRVALSVGAARPTMMKEVEGAFAFSPPPPSPSPSPASPLLPPPSPFATVADALTVAPPLTTQPVAAAALFAAAHPPSPPLPSTSRRTRLRLHRRPLAACRPRRCTAARRCRGIASAPSSGAEGTLCWRVCSL